MLKAMKKRVKVHCDLIFAEVAEAAKRFKRTIADREALTEPELKRMMELDLKGFTRLEVI